MQSRTKDPPPPPPPSAGINNKANVSEATELQFHELAVSRKHSLFQMPLYFTTINFKTTLIIRPLNLAPK